MKSYEQLNLTVEELEKRLKYLKKDESGNLSGVNSRLSTLESDYSNINSQTQTNTSNISTLQTSVAGVSSDVSSLQTSVAGIAGNISTLQSSVSANTNNISSLQTLAGNNSSAISALDGRVETLENSNTNSICETFNCFNIKDFAMNLETYGSYENFFTCFFTCETTSYVKLKMKFQIEINNNEERTKNLNVILNGNVIDTHSYTVNGTLSDTYTVEYTFLPTQKNNNILYKSTETSSTKRYCRVKLVDCFIEICGRNIEILNHQNDLKVYLSQNKYYITKNSGSTATYKILNFGDTDITSDFLPVPRPIYNVDDTLATGADKYTYTYFNYQILPVINFNSTTNKFEINNSDLFLVASTNVGYFVYGTLLSAVPKHNSAMQRFTYSAEYSVSSPGAKKSGNEYVIDTSAKNTYAVKDRGSYYLIFTNGVVDASSTSSYTVTLNGNSLPGKWVHNEAVFAKDWETTPNRKYCCIATNELGENYFFPDLEATYCVYIGEGSQTSAYMQSDGSINVYISHANKIYKYVLTFNSNTNKYELTSSTYLQDGQAYLEGYSNDYFYKKGETWYYVSPAQN